MLRTHPLTVERLAGINGRINNKLQDTIPLEIDENREKSLIFSVHASEKVKSNRLKHNLTQSWKEPFMSFGMLLVMKSILKQDFYLKS